MRFGFVLQYVDDIEASTRFYRDVLGLKVQRTHPVFIQFENFALAADESMTGTREDELYWLVDDAPAAFEELSKKAEISMPLRETPFGKLFAVRDPDGRQRFVIELSASRPSQPVV